MNFTDGLLIAGLLILLFALVSPVLFGRPKRVRNQEETEAGKAADAASIAKRMFAEQVGLTFALLLLRDKIDRMRSHAESLPVPGDDPLSDIGREKRIILEQIRIADFHCREIAVAMVNFDSTTLEAVRWPFTAADLQLSFAQRRLDSWRPAPDQQEDQSPGQNKAATEGGV